MKRLLTALAVALLLTCSSFGQTTGLMPVARQQFVDITTGLPLSAGCVFTYATGTSTPLASYVDSTGTIPNSNPVILNSAGMAPIWLSSSLYRITVKSAGGLNCVSGTLQYTADNVSNSGLRALTQVVLLNPSGGINQTIAGPLTATYFSGSTAHTTSPGVRVSILAPTTVLDSATNPPNVVTVSPLAAGQNYRVPDPLGHANFVLSPDASQAGANVLDCTLNGITCKRYGFAYFESAGCNGSTSALGWDTFSTNAPVSICLTGTNVQKGLMAFPSAATKITEANGTGAAAGTCTATYPSATLAGDLLVAGVVVDGGKTVTGVTDGTNAYTKATSIANGNTDLEVWYFNGNSTAMAASSTLTVTLSAAANCAIDWLEYRDVKTSGQLDVTATNTGTGTAVTTGTTAGTAQNTELVLSFVGSPSNPSVGFQNGTTGHSTVSQSTNVTASSQGLIQQATSTQAGSFTLGSSQAWASAIVTFKANVASSVSAQRQFVLPPNYVSSIAMNAPLKWQSSLVPTGTIQVKLGAQVVCTQDGSTDDPAFLAATTATPSVPSSTGNVVTTTTLNALTTTGCAPSNLMHFQVQRLRYDPLDTYEGYVYLAGAGLQFGVN